MIYCTPYLISFFTSFTLNLERKVQICLLWPILFFISGFPYFQGFGREDEEITSSDRKEGHGDEFSGGKGGSINFQGLEK